MNEQSKGDNVPKPKLTDKCIKCGQFYSKHSAERGACPKAGTSKRRLHGYTDQLFLGEQIQQVSKDNKNFKPRGVSELCHYDCYGFTTQVIK